MSKEFPESFDDLDAKELYRSAIEDFAVEVDEADKGKKKVLQAALLEANITWEDYLDQHPEFKPTEPEKAVSVVSQVDPVPTERTPDRNRGAVVTAKDMTDAPVREEVVIITQQELPVNRVEKHLIKMTRPNLLFQIEGHTFTKDNPYQLVDPATANKILREDGFVLARPDEVQEFYS